MQRNTPKVSDLVSGLKYTVYQCERLGLLNCNIREAKLHDAEIRNVIKKAYEKFNSNDVFNYWPTGSSKLPHLVIPDLFMMWDRDIRTWPKKVPWFEVKDSWDAENYLLFLQKMQNQAQSLYQANVVKELIEKQEKSLAKLIYQYNLLQAKREKPLNFKHSRSLNNS